MKLTAYESATFLLTLSALLMLNQIAILSKVNPREIILLGQYNYPQVGLVEEERKELR